MRIFVDADGCPVVDLTIKCADNFGVAVTLVCDTAHDFSKRGVEVITADKGADSADLVLVNLISKGDIVVTQDYGLAAMCLAKKANVIDQNGMIYDDDNIDSLLLSRHISKKLRRSGQRMKGPHKRTADNDERFRETLEKLLRNLTEV